MHIRKSCTTTAIWVWADIEIPMAQQWAKNGPKNEPSMGQEWVNWHKPRPSNSSFEVICTLEVIIKANYPAIMRISLTPMLVYYPAWIMGGSAAHLHGFPIMLGTLGFANHLTWVSRRCLWNKMFPGNIGYHFYSINIIIYVHSTMYIKCICIYIYISSACLSFRDLQYIAFPCQLPPPYSFENHFSPQIQATAWT